MSLKRYGWSAFLGCAGTAFAQLPPAPEESKSPADPVIRVPVVEAAPAPSTAIKIVSAEVPPEGSVAFSKMLVEAKAAYAKTRDYVGHIVRQERVHGTLQAEQIGEIRVRTAPFAIDLKMVAPKAANGWETAYVTGRKAEFVRFRPTATASMLTLKPDDPKVLAGNLHPIDQTGLLAIITRAEKMVEVEKKMRNPVQVVVAEYKFEGKSCLRFEIFCERPHALRYARRAVLYVDKETKLPVRWEAYEGPKPGDPNSELLERISFVNLKFNVGLGESAFDK